MNCGSTKLRRRAVLELWGLNTNERNAIAVGLYRRAGFVCERGRILLTSWWWQSFLVDFDLLGVRHQKVQLQAILKSAYVHRDERIELEFRG